MFAKCFFLWVALFALPLTANTPGRPQSMDESLRQVRTHISDLKHEIHNHENEIRTFENRLHTQETILENVKQQIADSLETHQDQAKAQSVNIESKVASLDALVQGLISDLRLIKTQSNESVSILSQYKQKMSELEKIISNQNEHMKNLEAALQSIVEVLQAKEATEKVIAKSTSKTYKVQSGDTLEKIAKKHNVSIQTLRDLNGLKKDKIFVGQNLKVGI